MTFYGQLESRICFDNSEDCENNEFLEPEYTYTQKMTPFMAAINNNGSLNH